MLNWEQIIFRSFYYIGIASPFVFAACYAIICISQYLKQKDEKNRKMLKQYKKQTRTKHTRLTDINSDSSTQLCWIQVENPNQHLYRLDETHPLMNSYFRDSAYGSFINDPDKRHLKYSDSILLLPEEGTFEDMSEDETDLCEKLPCLQNKRNKSQEELISLNINDSMKNVQSKCRSPRSKIIYCGNSIRKQCKCNRGDTKSYTKHKNTIKENQPIDDTPLTIKPVEVIHKNSDCKCGVHDREISISSLKHASNNSEELETDISTQKFQQYHFENDQKYIVNSKNILPLLKCPKCTVSNEENFTHKIQETECFPNDRHNQQEISNYHKSLRAPLFQNSNIPIAKRVLEDDQFYDLRQKFCGAENILNASKPMTDEQRLNRWITNNKEIYHLEDKSYTVRGENAPKPMTDEQRFNRWITNNKEIYQPDEKSYTVRGENASKPMTDEQHFNRWITNNKEIYQPDEKSYTVRGENASKSMTDEQRFNRWITKNKETYQPDEKSYTVRDENASKPMADELRFNRWITNNKEIYQPEEKSYTVRSENAPKPMTKEQRFNRWITNNTEVCQPDENSYTVRGENASKPMTDQQCFNRWITNNKEVCQPDEKSYTVRGEKYFEVENTKYPRIRYAAHFIEETGNENQTSNVSSTCDSSDKEEVMCNYWKSLKTKKASRKRNKGIQVDISSVRSNDPELLLQMNTDETKGFSKDKSQEVIQSRQAQKTIVKQVAQSSTRNQSTQINRNQKLHIPTESSQTEIVEHYPNLQLHSAQMPDDKRHTENRTYKNCKSFLAPGDYLEERIDATKPRTIYSKPRLIQTESHPYNEHLMSDYTPLTENTENIQYYDNCSLKPNFTRKWENVHNRCNADYDLQNKRNYVCNPTMPMNHYESNQYLNTYNDTKQRQTPRTYFEQGNMPLSNQFVQHDKDKHRTPPAEQNICDNSEQIVKSQFPNFREFPNKISVVTHQYVQNKSSMNDPNIPINVWKDENTVSYENKLYVKNRDIQNEDDSIQLLSHKTKNRQKMNDVAETDVKGVQTSEVILVPPNHAKEHSKQTSKGIPKKSKSQIKIDAEQAVEKSKAEQIQAKENVLKQIKRMYSHMDQNVHETNKSVITQVKKVLKSKGMWHSEK